MKALTYILNLLGIAIAGYLFLQLQLIEPLIFSSLLLLTLISLFAHIKDLALISMILNVCSSCGLFVAAGIVIFSDTLSQYPLSLGPTLALMALFLITALSNITQLKAVAGIKKH